MQRINHFSVSINQILYAWIVSIIISLIIAIFTGCVTRGFPPDAQIQNFDYVTPQLCRGAQPNVIGIDYLARQHVTLIVNLRDRGDEWDRESTICMNEGIKYAWIPLPGASAPSKETEDLIQFLIEKEIETGGKVFVHCQHGCDRTGTTIACYEIRHGVSNSVALKEAKFYGLSSFERCMINFIKKYKPLEDAMTPQNAPSTVQSNDQSL